MTDLSIVIPAWSEAPNLSLLLPAVQEQCVALGVNAEILVVDAGSRDGTVEVCQGLGVRLLDAGGRGFGRALRVGFAAARGEFVLTMDADLSHPADVVQALWQRRGEADLLIASRFVPGGSAVMPRHRILLSRALNALFARALAIPVRDLSSGFRLYRRAALREIPATGANFDVLPELVIRAHARGFRIREVPFRYASRRHGASHIRMLAFGWSYLATLTRLLRLRAPAGADDRPALDKPGLSGKDRPRRP